MTFCSPQGAMEEAKYFDLDEGEFEFGFDEVRYLGKPIFPIFGYDRKHLCVVVDWQEKHPSPIVWVSELYVVGLEYVSLTSMMQVTAEAWETGVAYIDEEGLVECDEQKFFAIYRQHNSELPQMILVWLKSELETAGLECCRLDKTWDSISENVHWLTKCWPELSVLTFPVISCHI